MCLGVGVSASPHGGGRLGGGKKLLAVRLFVATMFSILAVALGVARVG